MNKILATVALSLGVVWVAQAHKVSPADFAYVHHDDIDIVLSMQPCSMTSFVAKGEWKNGDKDWGCWMGPFIYWKHHEPTTYTRKELTPGPIMKQMQKNG